MSSSKSISAQARAYEAAQRKANQRSKRAIFDALATTDITSVTVTFDGEGDEGQIESVCALSGDVPAQLPSTRVAVYDACGDTGSVTKDTAPLEEAIERACYGLLAEQHGGWETNEGAYGDFVFHVAARRISLDLSERFVGTTDSHHEY